MQEPANTTSPLRSNNRPSQCDDVDNEKDIHEMSSSNQYTQLSFLPTDSNDEDSAHRENMEEEMKLEKKRYPGASTWAPAEERLFEILFMRQDLPMLPPTWDVDLRGIPISDVVFETSEDYPPIIYAHLKNFAATQCLTRLVDLTSRIRTTCQSGHRKRAPQHIKRELDRYLNWAAQDGGYMHLRIVPNIMTEVIDTAIPENEITDYISKRMRLLAKLQREFLRADRNSQFWDVVKPSIFKSPKNTTDPKIKIEIDDRSPSCARWLTPAESLASPHPHVERVSAIAESHGVDIKVEPGLKSPSIFATAQAFEATRISKVSSPPYSSPSPPTSGPQTPPERTYTRHPPAVYGLFILNTSVLVLTTDSSRGPDSYVSFHVQVDFFDEHQGVWNALTIALVACLARDELRTRLTDFEELPVVEDSDPDA
ncbi:unnamed protein product [Fusarium graminearum]|nr:hypothetical protein HG531_006229 [Fusarium graminearum]CAF3553864.1 unnamed protein product [Fusarium graminearum]CAF3566788.1 unnamed protein product [Fusarium graminearum]CAG1976224.1 unnamed protein product [Fusarium graminearum]CAG2000700.1 unnamed protein product [Fusarium graminearum]